MFSPLLDMIWQYGGMLLGAIIYGLIWKAYCASRVQSKIRKYQCEIVKSHAKILELEAKNEQLEKRIKDTDVTFVKGQLILN